MLKRRIVGFNKRDITNSPDMRNYALNPEQNIEFNTVIVRLNNGMKTTTKDYD